MSDEIEVGTDYHLRKAGHLYRVATGERDRLKAELAVLRSAYDEAIGIVDEVFQSCGDREAIMPDFLLPGECKFKGVKALAIAYRNTESELAKLQAEREPRDNGDGTVTAMLPVTYPKGLDVVEGRKPGEEDAFVTDVRLIVRDAPKPPEPVTWEAPLADGVWLAEETRITDGCRGFGWSGSAVAIRGLSRPAKLGRYRFKNGVGTLLIEESK